jgi:hypothetical protein
VIASINYLLNKKELFEAFIKFVKISIYVFKQKNPKSFFLKKKIDHLFEIFILLYFTNPIEISNSTRLESWVIF